MLIKIDVDSDQYKRIQNLINDRKYEDIHQFIKIAINNQIQEEQSSESENNEIQSESIGDRVQEIIQERQEELAKLLGAVPLEKSEIEPEHEELISNFYNRFFPVKLVVSTVARLMVQKKTWIELSEVQEDASKFAESVSAMLQDIEEMAKMCGIGSIGYAKEALLSLKRDYEDKNSALQIIEQGSKFKLNIRKEYLYLTESLLTDSELDRPTQETLAVIAYKNPALQSEIIKIRGNGAYDHIKVLKELDFVVSEPTGRTKILKLTNKFYDYFDVDEDQLRSKLQDAPKNSLPENEINNETKVVTQDETSN